MKNSFKALLLLGASSLVHADIAATTQDIRAFVLPQETLTLRTSYSRANDALNFFRLNDKADTNNIYSGIDESAGMNLTLGYGAHQFLSLYYKFEALNIHYAGNKIENRSNELFARINFYDTPHNSFDDLSLDVGFIRNASDDFNNLSGLSDNSYYLRLLLGSKFNTSLLNFYTGFKYSSIKTTQDSSSLDRDERALMAGFSYTQEISNYVLDINYEYMRIFGRESALSENKSNQLINLNLSRVFNENFLLFIGTRIMLNQFNGFIPYLYNRQTQSAFDKSYSLMNLGFVYNFDLATNNKREKVYKAPTDDSTTLFSFFGW